jgi:hypothetical protein
MDFAKKQVLKNFEQLKAWHAAKPKTELLVKIQANQELHVSFDSYISDSYCPPVRLRCYDEGKPWSKLQTWLEKRGFQKLGSGAYGHVLGHPKSDKVIKILRRPSQDGWLDYIRWAKKHNFLGTFAPKVTSYKYIKNKDGDFGVAVMERLDKTLYHVDRKHDARFIQEAMMHSLNGNGLAGKFLSVAKPGSDEFIQSFLRAFGREGGDFHAGNWMTRKDGTLVLIDPLCRPGVTDPKERFKLH